ncbi:MAG: D-hexose-6-phosphate mutarotase [Burkholderiales bacterium]|nr:D-hexose-6-phosphate mutarotase [Burkholderiales bacterium]
MEELNGRFGIEGQVVFRAGPSGVFVDVENDGARAMIALQGAQVVDWVPRGEAPVIWLSRDAKFAEGKSIRGGAPVCWPWFGPHRSELSFPAHGFARTVPWEVIETRALADGSTRLIFRLKGTEASRTQWPHATQLENHITVGKTLEVDLVTRNFGNESVTIGQALHTYFSVGDIRKVSLHGLDGRPYLDKVDGFSRKIQGGEVTFAGETDRIYLDSTGDCIIADPVLGRSIRIAKRGSASTVVWNPWDEKADKMGDMGENGWLEMLCVENANAADDVRSLAPGAEHHLWVSYRVE